MEPLTYLGMATASAAALNVAGGITRWARARRTQPPPEDTPASAPLPPPRAEEAASARSARPAADDEASAWYWTLRLLSMPGLFGLFAGPVQLPVLLINSHLLAATLETVLDTSGVPLLPLNIAGAEYVITNMDLIGLLISLGQMLAASGLHIGWHKRLWFIFGLALLALPSLIVFEVWASFQRGLLLDGSFRNASLSALQSAGIATLSAAIGCYFLDHFLIPLALAVLWAMVAPWRALARWWDAQPVVRRSWVPALVAPLAALDVVFQPLRSVDQTVGRLIARRQPLHEGDQHHATTSTRTNTPHEPQFTPVTPEPGAPWVRNGHLPDRVDT